MATLPSVLIAVDKFKGSLSGAGLSEAIAEGMKDELGRSFEPLICPIADGGDGTVEAALAAGFREIMAPVSGPLGEPVEAQFAYALIIPDNRFFLPCVVAVGFAEI